MARKHFLNIIQNEGVQSRTHYQHTIEALSAAFNHDQLYYGFYENMFEPKSVNELSQFLALATRPDFADQIHNSSESLTMPIDLREVCKREYADTYAYCFQHFPVTQALWSDENTQQRGKPQLGSLASLLPWVKK